MFLCVPVFVLDGTLQNVFRHLRISSDPMKNLGTLNIKNVMPINVKQLGVYIKRGESEHADVPLKVMKKN